MISALASAVLFPLGRYYEDRSFRYFYTDPRVQKKDRPHQVRVRKWIDTPDFDRYEKVCLRLALLSEGIWRRRLLQKADDPSFAKMVQSVGVKMFYMMPYDGQLIFMDSLQQNASVRLERLILLKKRNYSSTFIVTSKNPFRSASLMGFCFLAYVFLRSSAAYCANLLNSY